MRKKIEKKRGRELARARACERGGEREHARARATERHRERERERERPEAEAEAGQARKDCEFPNLNHARACPCVPSAHPSVDTCVHTYMHVMHWCMIQAPEEVGNRPSNVRVWLGFS
jgi:hypothetical protein